MRVRLWCYRLWIRAFGRWWRIPSFPSMSWKLWFVVGAYCSYCAYVLVLAFTR